MSVPWIVALGIAFGWGCALGAFLMYRLIAWALKSEAESRA